MRKTTSMLACAAASSILALTSASRGATALNETFTSGDVTDGGLWSTAAVDTASFLDLSIKRCQAQIKAMRFGAGLFVCELAFCLGWVYRYSATRVPLLTWLFGSVFNWLVWLFSLAFFVFVVWYGRKKRAELAWLLSLSDVRAL